jgi:uncharacterized membrane protein YkvA (DUF1232 family)
VAAFAGRLAAWARSIKRDVHAVYLASRDPRTPWCAKALAIGVVAYALSPIDLVPDFIPVLGQLDELIILPLGLWLVVRLIPPDVMNEHRAAAIVAGQMPRSMAGAVTIIAIWLLLTVGSGWLAYRWLF